MYIGQNNQIVFQPENERVEKKKQYLCRMSPRVLLIDGYDFFFYSKEEERKHVHIEKGENEAKIWLEPTIEVAYNYGFTAKEIKLILQITKEYERIINDRWDNHFGKRKKR